MFLPRARFLFVFCRLATSAWSMDLSLTAACTMEKRYLGWTVWGGGLEVTLNQFMKSLERNVRGSILVLVLCIFCCYSMCGTPHSLKSNSIPERVWLDWEIDFCYLYNVTLVSYNIYNQLGCRTLQVSMRNLCPTGKALLISVYIPQTSLSDEQLYSMYCSMCTCSFPSSLAFSSLVNRSSLLSSLLSKHSLFTWGYCTYMCKIKFTCIWQCSI